MLLDKAEYERIITVFPRVCVDILLTDTNGQVLLLKRTNQPASGQWWFPGGRIHIGETRLEATHRKLEEECGLEPAPLTELGSSDLFFVIEGATYHDVTLLFQRTVEAGQPIRIDAEASEYGWFDPHACKELGLHPYVLEKILMHAKPTVQPKRTGRPAA